MEKEHCGSNISKHNTTQMQITVRSALPSFKLLQTEGKPPEIEEHPEMELNQTDQTASVARSQRHPILAGPFLPLSMRTQCFLQHFREGRWTNRQRKCRPCIFHHFCSLTWWSVLRFLTLSCRFPFNYCLSPVHCWICSGIQGLNQV